MRLGEFLSSARPAPHKPVQFRAIGKGTTGEPTTSDVDAVFIFVDEKERQKARMDALDALRKEFPGSDPPPSAVADEFTYHVLYRALRDASDPSYRVYLAESVTALKNALVWRVAADLDEQYNEWVEQEFPDRIDAEKFALLKEEAKKKSLGDLLTDFDYSTIRKALPSLARAYGK